MAFLPMLSEMCVLIPHYCKYLNSQITDIATTCSIPYLITPTATPDPHH